MKIQFVCTGNTFRSRIAEAYLKSKNVPNLIISSSGIKAEENINGPVCDYTVSILEKNNLLSFLSKKWTQASKEGIEKQDLVIFLDNTHYEFCCNYLHCNISNYEIWYIKDMPEEIRKIPRDENKVRVFAENNFKEIKEKIDLLLYIKKF